MSCLVVQCAQHFCGALTAADRKRSQVVAHGAYRKQHQSIAEPEPMSFFHVKNMWLPNTPNMIQHAVQHALQHVCEKHIWGVVLAFEAASCRQGLLARLALSFLLSMIFQTCNAQRDPFYL